MVKRFDSYSEYAKHLQQIRRRQLPLTIRGMLLCWAETAAKDLQGAIIGRIMPLGKTGTFIAWAPLKNITIAIKTAKHLGKGGDPRTMLYATGALHGSIKYRIDASANTAIVGTNDKKAEWLEYGTIRMPPRPFIGPAGLRAADKLNVRFHKLLSSTLEGKPPFRGP